MERKIKPLEITNIERVENVLKDKKIHQATEDELKSKLKIIYAMIGLRPHHFPIDEEKAFLHDYILRKYANKTLNELVLAFDLAIQGQLNIDDAKVYDQFTCEYFAKIMNGYRDWLKMVSKNATMYKKEVLTVADKREITDEEMQEWVDEWIAKEKIDLELIPSPFYDFLVKTKAVEVSKERKWEYTEKATTSIKVKLHEDIGICKTTDAYIAYGNFERMEKEGFVEPMKSRILNRAKRLIVYEYLMSKKNV